MDRGRAPGDRLAMLGGGQPRPDLVRLAGSEAGGGDLARLVLEHLEPPGQLAGIDDQLVEGRAIGAPAIDGGFHGRPQLPVPPERVEEVALPALVEQALLVVLAVDLDERPDLVGEPARP